MTSTEMIDLLALRLEDPENKAFSVDTKYRALNVAQLTIINLIDNSMLTELETKETVTLSSGVYDLANLTDTPIRNGVYAVYNNNATIGAFLNLIEFKDVKRLENTYLGASTSNPVGYIFQNKIHSFPENNDSVDIYFLKKPLNISNGQDCTLDEALHESVVDFAEAQLWKMDGQQTRASSAQENAMGMLSTLNTRLEAEKPQGVGTYGRVKTSAPNTGV